MPDNKKHHYVPKFHLKYFSFNNQKNISLYNTKNEKYIDIAQLRNQAYADYLYGKDIEPEKTLSVIENIVKSIIDEITMKDGVLKTNLRNLHFLYTYIVLQMNRTINAKNNYEMQNLEIIKLITELDPKYKDIKHDFTHIRFNNVSRYLISEAVQNAHVIFDLDYRVIVNYTDNEFILSDNPVVRYNYFNIYKKLPPGGIGYASKGLEIFFPLTPKYTIIFFDKKVYKFGGRRKVIKIYDNNEIKNLNGLQYLNCHENMYFSHKVSEYYIRRLVQRFSKNRIDNFNPVARFYPAEKQTEESCIVNLSERIIMRNIAFSYIKPNVSDS